MKILVLNCGSSSLKFQLINMENEQRLIKGNFERIGGMKTTLKLNINGEKMKRVINLYVFLWYNNYDIIHGRSYV